MTTYVMLANWTEQGIAESEGLATSPGRCEESSQGYERRVQIVLPDHGRL
ncbi:uncharacterized protein with GYD domain [Bradyrhizobium sp. AZCC 2289]